MKNLVLLSVFMLLVFSKLFSQISLTATDVNPTIGENFQIYSISYPNPGASGSNQNWDFSNLSIIDTSQIICDSTPNMNANIRLNNGSVNYSYFSDLKVDSSGQELIASNDTYYYNSEKLLVFPLTYGANYTDTFYGRENAIISLQYDSLCLYGSKTIEIDAYGSLTLPNNIVLNDVVRVHTLFQSIDSVYKADTGYLANNSTVTKEVYQWFKAGYHYPIMELDSILYQGNISKFGFISYDQTLGVNNNNETNFQLIILGNPAHGILSYSIKNKSITDLQVQLTNLSGQIVYSKLIPSTLNRNSSNNIDVSSLSAGMYCLSLSNHIGIINKLVMIE